MEDLGDSIIFERDDDYFVEKRIAMLLGLLGYWQFMIGQK